MNFRILCTSLSVSFLSVYSGALCAEPSKPVPIECGRINFAVSSQIARGEIDDAMHTVSKAPANHSAGGEAVCAGLLSNSLAAGLQISGRLEEARTFAEQAIKYFERSLPADDPVYLAPLHILATIDLEQGLTAKARQLFLQMQNIPSNDPHDRVLVLVIGASLLVREGRKQEAESRFKEALLAVSQGGKQNGADAVVICGQLAYVYLQEHRYEDAQTTLDAAFARLGFAGEAVPLDRIKLLNLRAFVSGRQNRWRDAESDLAEAVSLSRQQRRMDSAELEPILTNYAYVLRRLHRRDARSVEKWAKSVRRENKTSGQVIDVADLAANRSANR